MITVVMSSDSSMPSGLFLPTRVVEAPKGTEKDGTYGNPGRLERNERQDLARAARERISMTQHDAAVLANLTVDMVKKYESEKYSDPTLGEDEGDARTLSRRTQARRQGHRGTAQGRGADHALVLARVSGPFDDLFDWIRAEASVKRRAAAVRGRRAARGGGRRRHLYYLPEETME